MAGRLGIEKMKDMSIKNVMPSDNYKDLRTQFFAMKKIIECKNAEIDVYQKRIKEFSVDRIIQLEAELESQKEMNAILTKELDQFLEDGTN